MNRKLKLIGILILLIIIFSSCSLIDSLTKKDNSENVFYGTAEAQKINISSEVSGKIKQIKVEEGSEIKSGELIAIIDGSESKIKLEQADIGIKGAQNSSDEINMGNRQEDIQAQRALVDQAAAMVKQGTAAVSQAENNLELAKTTFDFKKKTFEDTKKLYENKAETEFNLNNAKNQMDIAENALKNAKAAVESTKAQLQSFIA